MATLIELDDDCLSVILSFLPLGDLFLQASLVNKSWFSIIITLSDERPFDWLNYVKYFLEQTATRYEELVVKSLQQESELIVPKDDFHNYNIGRKGMRGIYRNRAKHLRSKLLDDQFLEDAASCQIVAMRIIAHEWYYLFHNFRKRFVEIRSSLTCEEIKEILFKRNLSYSPHVEGMELCTRDFMENFAKLSGIYTKQAKRVMDSKFLETLFRIVKCDVECLEIALQNPTFKFTDKITSITNLKEVSCDMFRQLMQKMELIITNRGDLLSELFNERIDFFHIAIEEVSKRSPRGIYLLLGESLGKCNAIFDIDNPQLEAYIVKYYKLEYLMSQCLVGGGHIHSYLSAFLQTKPYKNSQYYLVRHIIINKIRRGDHNKLIGLLESFRNCYNPKFKVEELDIDDECVYYSLFNGRKHGLDFTFLTSLLEYCSDYNCKPVIKMLKEREPKLAKKYQAQMEFVIEDVYQLWI